MTDPIAPATDLDTFRANVLKTWAQKANEQNWNGEFNSAMTDLGFSQAELDEARNAGQTVHTLTITVRTAGAFRINGGFGSIEDTVAREVRQGFNLTGRDSVQVSHTTADAA